MNIKNFIGKFAVPIKNHSSSFEAIVTPLYIYDVNETNIMYVDPNQSEWMHFSIQPNEVERLIEEKKVNVGVMPSYSFEWELFESVVQKNNKKNAFDGRFAFVEHSILEEDKYEQNKKPVFIHKTTDDYTVICVPTEERNRPFFSDEKEWSELKSDTISLWIEEGMVSVRVIIPALCETQIEDYQHAISFFPILLTNPYSLKLNRFVGKKIFRTQKTKSGKRDFQTEPFFLLHMTNHYLIGYDAFDSRNEHLERKAFSLPHEELFRMAESKEIHLTVLKMEWLDENWSLYDDLIFNNAEVTNENSLHLMKFKGQFVTRSKNDCSPSNEYNNQSIYLHNITDTHIVIYAPYSIDAHIANEINQIELDPENLFSIDLGIKLGVLEPQILGIEWIDQVWELVKEKNKLLLIDEKLM